MKTQKVFFSLLFFTTLFLSFSLFGQNKDEIKAIGHIASWDKLIKEKQDVVKGQIKELEKQEKAFSQWYKSKFNHCGPAFKKEEDKTKFYRCPTKEDKQSKYYRTNIDLLRNDNGEIQYRFRLENWATVNSYYVPINYLREVILSYSAGKLSKVEIATKLNRISSSTYDQNKSIVFDSDKLGEIVSKVRIGSVNEKIATKKNADADDIKVLTTKFPRMSSVVQKKLLDKIEVSLQQVIYKFDKLIRAYEVKRQFLNDNQASEYNDISPILK